MKKIKNVKLSLLFNLFMLFSLSITAQINWTKYSSNPVLQKGPEPWDSIGIGQPTVLFENDTIKMWYAGVGDDWKARICYAYSIDGINWVKHSSPVINVGNPGDWDSGWLDTPEIIKDNNGYKMYYYGDTCWQFSAINSSIGLAYSSDGINWTKENSNPVFQKGNPGEWDETWVESPALFWDSISGDYMMWYNGVDTNTWKVLIGVASSTDGISWTKNISNPVLQAGSWGSYDDMWLGTPAVIKIDSVYELWYSAAAANDYDTIIGGFGKISICYATSDDGLSWTKHQSNPLFNTFSLPYDSLIDTGGPWAFDVIYNPQTDNYMGWYEAHTGIGMASSPRIYADIEKIHRIQKTFVYPNPIVHSGIIYSTTMMNNAGIQVFNSLGQLVYSCSRIYGKEIKIERENFKAGVYHYLLLNENELNSGSFVVQ